MMQKDHANRDHVNVSEIVVKECKATYPKIWSRCDLGALIRVMCHREGFPDKISEKNSFKCHDRKLCICKYI